MPAGGCVFADVGMAMSFVCYVKCIANTVRKSSLLQSNNILIAHFIEKFKKNPEVVRAQFWSISKGYQGIGSGWRGHGMPSGTHWRNLVF